MRLIWIHQTGVKIILSGHFRRQFSLMQTGRQSEKVTQEFTNFGKLKDHQNVNSRLDV